jgi:hypothetical protein
LIGGISERQPLLSGFPKLWFRRQPDEYEFVDCRSYIETLRDEEDAAALLSGPLENTELSRHRAHIVRNEYALLVRRQRQNIEIAHAA